MEVLISDLYQNDIKRIKKYVNPQGQKEQKPRQKSQQMSAQKTPDSTGNLLEFIRKPGKMAEYKGNILKSLTFLHMTMNAYEWKWKKKFNLQE